MLAQGVAVHTIESCESPVGPLIIAATADAVCLVHFCEESELDAQMSAERVRHAATLGEAPNPHLTRLRAQLAEYFAGRRREFDVPLHFPGSPFQQQVWAMLIRIPYGERWSYLDVARQLGDPRATRAVGAANGANPIAIVIPCHRVVNADGELGGYGGGLWRKRILLDLELGQGALSL
jgi:O-6-methylguanine DNA methyltransferase